MPDAEKSHSNPYAAAPCSSVTRITRKDLAKYDPRDAGGPSSQFFASLRPSVRNGFHEKIIVMYARVHGVHGARIGAQRR